jgi:hypothetical protein
VFVEWKIKAISTTQITTNFCPVFVAQYEAGNGRGRKFRRTEGFPVTEKRYYRLVFNLYLIYLMPVLVVARSKARLLRPWV